MQCSLGLDCFNELINLKDLTIISYAHNNLIFDVKSLQNLINLEHLHFQTKYRGDLFEYIEKLKFNLSCIKELKYLKNIKELNIVINEDDDKLIKEIPPEVLPNIVEIGIADLKKHLEIHDCRKIIGEYLYCLQNLKTLRTSDTKIKDSHLFQLKQLETLEVESCKNITGEFLLHLNKLKNLTIMGINIKQEYLKLLKNMENVKTDVFEEEE
ncbi:hypothetical protein ABK040_007796 [Willaertia magna]